MAKATSDIMGFLGNVADTAAKRGKDFYQERQPPPITEDDEKRANEALLDPRRLVPVTPLLIKDTDHALCKAPLTRQEAAVTYSYVESGKNTAAARLKVAFEWNVKGSAFRIAVRDPAELAGQYFTTTSSKLLGYIPEGKEQYGPTHAKSLTSEPMHEDTVRESDKVSRKVSTGRRVRLVEKSLLNDIDLWVVHEDGSIQRKDDFDSGRETAGFWGTGAEGNKHKDTHTSKWTFGEVIAGHKQSSKIPFDEISTGVNAFKGHVVKKSHDLAHHAAVIAVEAADEAKKKAAAILERGGKSAHKFVKKFKDANENERARLVEREQHSLMLVSKSKALKFRLKQVRK
jgi:hypothetical protein